MRLAAAFCLLLLAGAAVARADAGAADACAAGLTLPARAIYDAARPAVAGGGDIRAAVTAATKGLVQAGEVSRGDARPAAQAAGGCLKSLQS